MAGTKRAAAVKTFDPVRGNPPALQWCAVGELQIDPDYQRDMDDRNSKALIGQIAREWDWDLCQVLVVADRGGDGRFVIDGQHRLAAARLRGDIAHLPCVIDEKRDWRFCSQCDARRTEAQIAACGSRFCPFGKGV